MFLLSLASVGLKRPDDPNMSQLAPKVYEFIRFGRYICFMLSFPSINHSTLRLRSLLDEQLNNLPPAPEEQARKVHLDR